MYLVFLWIPPPPTPEQYWDIKHYPTIRIANSNYLHLQIYPYD